MSTLHGFPPVLDAGVTLLLLGSFPSAASLDARQYYAHPRNQFWRLLGGVLREPLAELPYAQRLTCLLARGVGLWDVLGACERQGSLDSAIRSPRSNDFDHLHRVAPALRHVFFNGATAGRFAPALQAAGYATGILPSSSPAHAARSFEDKRLLWERALRPCLAGD